MSGPEKPDQHELRTLVARAQSGDARAFEKILMLHQHGLLRFCRSMINSSGEAEDVLQEVYLSAWRQLATLQSPRSVERVALPHRSTPLHRPPAQAHPAPAGFSR